LPFHTAETKKGEIEVKKKLISGIMATMFLATMITVALPARVSAASVPPITIGIVGPKGWIQWDGLWQGAELAANYINNIEGGINTPSGKAQLKLVDIDEHSVPSPDPSAAISELLTKLDANPTMIFIYGGFRTECVSPMEEAAMDYAASHGRPIWTIAGAATDYLIGQIASNYPRYKYMFRVTPLPALTMARTLAAFINRTVVPELQGLYYSGDLTHKVPTFVIAENLVWCDDMVAFFKANCTNYGMDYKGISRPSPIATDFLTDIAAATTAGAKIVIHIFSAVAGASFIKQVGDLKPKFACIGINVESQMQGFYAAVGGACQYETFLASAGTQAPTQQPLNPAAAPYTTTQFWTLYENTYGSGPVYTAWGSYDALIGLSETAYNATGAGYGWTKYLLPNGGTNTVQSDKLILGTETLGLSDDPGNHWGRVQIGGRWFRNGILGLFSYSGPNSGLLPGGLNPTGTAGGPDQGGSHDVSTTDYSFSPLDDGVVRALVVQWQAGRMEVVWPQDRTYSRKWIAPTWMYPLETDIAGGLTPAPTGIPGYSYNVPDTKVASEDMDAIAGVWFQVPPFNRLACDMQPYDHFVDVYDAARVGMDWGKSAVPA
jgi:branched-chain amino acid transport system substrate-binding protein